MGAAASMLIGLPGALGQVANAGYNAGVARQNADLADQAARDAEARGAIRTETEEQKGAQVLGAQKTAFGASGVTTAGSPTDVMTDTRYFTDINTQRAMNDAAREAWGYRTRAGQYRQQSQNDMLGGMLSIASFGLSGLTGGGGGGGGGGGLLGGS